MSRLRWALVPCLLIATHSACSWSIADSAPGDPPDANALSTTDAASGDVAIDRADADAASNVDALTDVGDVGDVDSPDATLDGGATADATDEIPDDAGGDGAADADAGPPVPSVVLLAGTLGGDGNADDVGTLARFYQPMGVAIDDAGVVFVADRSNNTIRKIMPGGVTSTFVGTPGNGGRNDGHGADAGFVAPVGLVFDSAGNLLVADSLNHAIRKVTPDGDVTTLAGKLGVSGTADGPADVARFNEPYGIALDAQGNLFVADSRNHTIRRIASDLTVTTVAGAAGLTGSADGTGADARFNEPSGVAVANGGLLVVADTNNETVRTITTGGVVTTLAGTPGEFGRVDSGGASARFAYPRGVSLDAAGNYLIADSYGSAIRKITPGGSVSSIPLIAGATPWAVALDSSGNMIVADMNDRVLTVSPAGVVTAVAGAATVLGVATDGPGLSARFYRPCGVALDSIGNVYIADSGNRAIRKMTPNGVVSTLAGKAGVGSAYVDGNGTDARFMGPSQLVVDSAGNLFITDSWAIRKLDPAGNVTTFAGSSNASGTVDANGTSARFSGPAGIAIDSSDNLYVSEFAHTVRKITPSGDVTTLAGTPGSMGHADGPGKSALFYYPRGLAVDASGNVFVTSMLTSTIRKITPAGDVSTIGGIPRTEGSADGPLGVSTFNLPEALTVDATGNVYVLDTGNSLIRKIDASGVVTTVAGVPRRSGVLTGPLPARLNGGVGIAMSPRGSLIASTNEQSIIEVFLP